MDMVEEVRPDQSLLLVVDVQNDFCHDDGAFGRAGLEMLGIQAAVERLSLFIDAARRVGVPVVFVKTHHDHWTNTPRWLTRGIRAGGRPEICATGSWGAEFFRVKPEADECVVVKHRYSAFLNTRLPVVLSALGKQTLLVAGVSTNVCVETTVRDAFMRDFDVVLLEDCAGAPTKAEHESAVHNVRTYFGRVLDSLTVAKGWGVSV